MTTTTTVATTANESVCTSTRCRRRHNGHNDCAIVVVGIVVVIAIEWDSWNFSIQCTFCFIAAAARYCCCISWPTKKPSLALATNKQQWILLRSFGFDPLHTWSPRCGYCLPPVFFVQQRRHHRHVHSGWLAGQRHCCCYCMRPSCP
jgi:hypothetical protein